MILRQLRLRTQPQACLVPCLYFIQKLRASLGRQVGLAVKSYLIISFRCAGVFDALDKQLPLRLYSLYTYGSSGASYLTPGGGWDPDAGLDDDTFGTSWDDEALDELGA